MGVLANVNGVELWFESVGQGPAILMMHGLGLDHSYLRPWHDELPARVIYYDHRGNGRSTRTAPMDHAAWHADAAALLDHVGESRAIIYGHSYGAWLALGFALRYPERVSRLVLCAASPAFDYTDEVIANAQARDATAAAALLTGLATPTDSDAVFARLWREILPLYFYGPPRPEVLANTVFSAAAFARGLECLAGFSAVPRLATLAMPVLVLGGAHDFITPAAQGKRITDAVPHGRFVELAASGHFPFVEEPRAYLDAFTAWLR